MAGLPGASALPCALATGEAAPGRVARRRRPDLRVTGSG